ncbi:MAG: 50S ribosomal protein L11 [Candidatus Micrarchaeota archaeon]
MKITIPALVEGGKATAGPPLGPALGPMGVNIGSIIAKINEKTKDFAGITVPVKVIVDKDTKEFEIEVGSPSVSALLKKELNIQKGSKLKDEKVGDVSLEQIAKLARMKTDGSLGKTMKARASEILGTCLTMGITCAGKDPRAVIKEIKEGAHDAVLKE